MIQYGWSMCVVGPHPPGSGPSRVSRRRLISESTSTHVTSEEAHLTVIGSTSAPRSPLCRVITEWFPRSAVFWRVGSVGN